MDNIPQVCYLYWNNAPMSFLHTVTIRSFHKHNPDWKIIVYNFITKKEAVLAPRYIHYDGPDMLNVIRTWDYVEVRDIETGQHRFHSILISDIWRREILYENGGVYSDFDVIWLKPVNYIRDIDCVGDPNKFASLVSYYTSGKVFHNVSVLISAKGSELDKKIIEAQKEVSNFFDDQAFGTTLLNKLYPEYKDIDVGGVLSVPYETFYPYSTFNLAELYLEDTLIPIKNKNVIAIHWFNGNPLSKMFINNQLYNTKCSLNTILKREGYVAN